MGLTSVSPRLLRRCPVSFQNAAQVVLHVQHRLLDAALPVGAEAIRVLRLAVGVEDAAARADDGAFALSEGFTGHVGGGALRAVAGEQEDRLRESGAKAAHRVG